MRRLAIAAMLFGSACASAPTSDAVVLDEFSIGLPAMAVSNQDLAIKNEGEFTHTLVIADELGRVVVATEPIKPGEAVSVPVDLDSGRYQFSCRIVVETQDGGISDHFELGMVADLEIGT